ncbi:MAG: hypothetical protein JWO25_376, partial [Alphaproteobacteria bacterium]|nr:hypothetical protein [Alphaproteobacteria bacterium]
GIASGKTECWYIVAAEPGATLGLGVRAGTDASALRRSALDGSIVDLMEWKPVAPGDFFYVPAGTVHAIGAGISLVEIQQNQGVTYRLYDYGRPRELHLDDGVAVAKLEPYAADLARDGRHAGLLVDGPHFTVVRVIGGEGAASALAGRDRWIVPLTGEVNGGGVGECLFLRWDERGDASADADFLVASVS